MCDPTVLAIASTVAGVAGSAAEYAGQQSAQNQQKKEYEAWAAQQSKNRAAENARQEGLRQQSQQAQQQGLQDVSADAQKASQAQEEQRLSAYLNQDQPGQDGAAPTSVSDKFLLSGQKAGEETFQTELAKKINESTADSRRRISALAKVGSYGGSFGGLDNTTTEALARSGSGIDIVNDMRRGSTGAYGVEQAVNPMQINYTPGPFASIAPQLLSFGMGKFGEKLGGIKPPVTGAP